MTDSKYMMITNLLNERLASIQSAALDQHLCRGNFSDFGSYYGHHQFANALKGAGLSIKCVDTSTTENEDSDSAHYAAVYSFTQGDEVICYVKFQGYTSSYDDFEFSMWTFVAPSEKTVLEFD